MRGLQLPVSLVMTRVGPIAYTSMGAGPLLLLLHANTHDRHDFDQISTALSRSRTVVAVDFPGHGDSPIPLLPVSAVAFAEAVEELIEHLGVERCSLIGNSVGGYAAARFAIRHPRRCAALVLVQTGGFLAPTLRVRLACSLLGRPAVYRRIARRFTTRYMHPTSTADAQTIERVVRFASSDAGSRLAAGLWRSFIDPEHDLRNTARTISAPTLIVWGSRDPIRPLSEGQDILRYIPHATFHAMQTGHVPFVSDPQGFASLVEPFLDQALARRQDQTHRDQQHAT